MSRKITGSIRRYAWSILARGAWTMAHRAPSASLAHRLGDPVGHRRRARYVTCMQRLDHALAVGAGRFWLSFHLPTSVVIGISIPTMA